MNHTSLFYDHVIKFYLLVRFFRFFENHEIFRDIEFRSLDSSKLAENYCFKEILFSGLVPVYNSKKNFRGLKNKNIFLLRFGK